MVKIVTDSTGYLPLEVLEQHDIRVVPLNVHFGEDRVYQEGVNLTNDEFYKMLAEAPALPTTSQPSPGQFRDVFGEDAGVGARSAMGAGSLPLGVAVEIEAVFEVD